MNAQKESVPVLFSEEEIADRLEELAEEIAAKMNTEGLMIVSLLRGSFMFTSDLVRQLYHVGVQPQIDFMTLSSYGGGIQSSGVVSMHADIREDVSGRPVLILDDILETGNTLDSAAKILKDRGASEVKIAVLLDKPGKRDKAMEADFVGFTIPDRFVIGYGLDYDNHFRELPFIGYVEIH